MRRTLSFTSILLLMLMTTTLFAEVFVNLPDTTAYPGDTLRVPIHVSDLTGLEVYSYQFKIKYDSKIVKVIGVDSAMTLTETWGMTWINLATQGQAIIGNYGVSPLQKSGILINVLVDIIGEINDSTRLAFQSFEFNAGQPTAKTTDGSIKILHPPVKVFFNTNVTALIKIQLDGIEKSLPFDTAWAYGSAHSIATDSIQFKTADVRFTFKSWSDGGDRLHAVTPLSDTTFALNMTEQYLLTINSIYGTAQGAGWYGKGKSATFTVDSLAQQNDSTRYIFDKWSGAGNSSYTGAQRTVTIIMNDPVVETAAWQLQCYLKINSPFGNPIGAGWHNQGDTVTIGIDSLVSLVEGTRYIFDSWTGEGNGSYSGNKRIAAIILSAPIVEQVVWQTEHYLWIRSHPAGIMDFERSGWYARHQTAITDTAMQFANLPEIIAHFRHWSIDGQALIGNPAQILMDTSHTAEAIYQIDSVRVTITTNIGVGTAVIVDGVRHAVPYSKFWSFQSNHLVGIDSMQFADGLKTRYRFESWSDHGAQQHVVQADTVLKLTATLSTQHFLFADTHPSGLIKFAAMGWHDQGNTVTLIRVPEQVIIGPETFNFKGWHVDKIPVSGNPIDIIMDKPHSAIALYTDLYFIIGQITDKRRQHLPEVEVILSGAFQDTFTIATNNEYYFNFLIQGDYQVTPYRHGFRFEPPYRVYASLQSSFSSQDYVAIDTLVPQIKLIYPNGGELLKSATTDTIFWQADDNMGIDSILIELSIDNGNKWQTIARLKLAGEKYIWRVPDISSALCKIRIHAVDFDGNRSFDTSNSPFAITHSSTIEDNWTEKLPTKFAVQQNYPNPFNNSTIIRFQTPAATQVTLTIFNTMGREIATLINQKLLAGYHQIQWDGKDYSGKLVSSGIYFYQLEASGKFITKRLLYIR